MSNYAGTGGGIGGGGGGGGSEVEFLKRRVQLAELPAAMTTGLLTIGTVPANRIIYGAIMYITTAPTGGGATTVEALIGVPSPGAGHTFFQNVELIGATGAQYLTSFNGNPADWVNKEMDADADVGARTASLQVNSDVNLDTLTAFDVTFIVAILSGTISVP